MTDTTKNIWVGLEVPRALSLHEDAGALTVGGLHLLRHQVAIALELAVPEQVCILTPQADSDILEINGEFNTRVLGPFDFISMLAERAKGGESGLVVQLRQTVPLKHASLLTEALKLANNGAVVSASKPPEGHRRHEPLPGMIEPDYRCLAFEVRSISAFGTQESLSADEQLAWINWADFTEITCPDDLSKAAEAIAGWGIK
ncbi:hypothetical protein OAU50_06135 [Planctomycetota bacterium]|nr:hypothetical protein [Planctomycetota bacterium]